MAVSRTALLTICLAGAAQTSAFAKEIPTSADTDNTGIEAPAVLPSVSAEAASPENHELSESQVRFPDVKAGTSHLVFYRQSRLSYALMGCGIAINGIRISALGNGRYFVMVVDPGDHVIAVDGYRRSTIRLSVAADTRTFVRCSMKSGFLRANPELSLEAESIANRDIMHLQYIDMNDASEYVFRNQQ
jgi:hypothetical protein